MKTFEVGTKASPAAGVPQRRSPGLRPDPPAHQIVPLLSSDSESVYEPESLSLGRVEPERGEGQSGSGETSLVYADGHIVFRRQDGTVILATATPEKYDVVHTFEPAYQEGRTWAHPVNANGNLLLREQGKLMCYRLKN